MAEIRPPVWRRVLVSDSTTLGRLHRIIQDVFGWQDYHLHEFTIHGVRYGDPASDEEGDFDLVDEAEASLRELDLKEDDHFGYEYDFGDSWEHSLRLEKMLLVEKKARLPSCIGGDRACPPEDVGGAGGYAGFLEAIADPTHPEHDDHLSWIGGAFDPDTFDIRKANSRLRRGSSARDPYSWGMGAEAGASAPAVVFEATNWNAPTPTDRQTTANELALRRDVETLITYLRDHKVTGTQSTGNLTLKAVAEISAGFVEPPQLERRIGTHVYRFRSEEEVWPVFFIHVLAWAAGLVSGGQGRRWRLNECGEAFASAPAFGQVLALLSAWWYRVNWLIAVRYSLFGDSLPDNFQRIVLTELRGLPVGKDVEFDPFVDRLIDQVGWTWAQPEPHNIRGHLGGSVHSIVVDPLEHFGVLSTRGAKDADSFFERLKLSSFSLTDFGRALIEAIASAEPRRR